MNREEAHTLLEVMAINITGELIGSGHLITEQTKLLAKQLEAIDMAIEALSTERTGEWIDCQKYGYVECPFCGHATNCEDNKDELHFCFYCGAEMGGDTE